MPRTPYLTKDGNKVPGVTSIIGNLGWNTNVLIHWGWQQGCKGIDYKEMRQKAADAGTLCHALIELHIMKSKKRLEEVGKEIAELKPKLSKEQVAMADQGFENFLKWQSMTQLEIVETEPTLVSEDGFGGTPDAIGHVGGDGLSIIDFKTGGGSGVYSEYKIQIAAYKVLWEQNRPEQPITGGFHLLKIAKEDASFSHHHYSNLDNAWDAFTHLLALHNLKKLLK